MSPRTSLGCLSIPPVRGVLSVLFLLILGAVPFGDGDKGVGFRIAVTLVVLMLGTIIWASTLTGFHREVREPRRLGEAVIVANRPRGVAIVVSWIALALTVSGLVAVGIFASLDAPGWVLAPVMLTVLIALPTATALPRLSRLYADGAGVVAVSPSGLMITQGHDEIRHPVPWEQIGVVRQAPYAAAFLGRPADGLGAGVRWRPGAQQAVTRWAAEGFAPTAAEVRALRLEAHWSPDPNALAPSRSRRWLNIASLAWALVACILLLIGILAVIAQGSDSWWVGLLLVWAPILGIAILAPRLVRVLRTDEARSATITAQGWFDILHGQGLVPWANIERIEVLDRHTVVITWPDVPPFRDQDLGNRLNRRLEITSIGSHGAIPSAGPLFREVGPHNLPYLPETRAFELAAEAEKVGGVDVRRSPTFFEQQARRSGAGPRS